MDVRTLITVWFRDKRTVVYQDSLLVEVVKEQLAMDYLPGHEPEKIHLQSIDKYLMFNRYLLEWFVQGEKDFEEIVSQLWYEGAYRNRADLLASNNRIIDAEEFWIKRGDKMVLVDDDDYVTAVFNKSLFYEI